MLLLFFSISFACLSLGYITHRNVINPQFIFVSLWSAIIFLGSLQLYGFTGFHDKVILIVMLGILAYTIGSVVCSTLTERISSQNAHFHRRLDDISELHINKTFLNICTLSVCISSLISFLNASKMFINGSTYTEVRGGMLGYTDKQFISNPYLSAFMNYVAGPMLTALLPLAVLFAFNRVYKKHMIAIFICLIANTLSSGGRITILYVLLFIIVTFNYYEISLPKRIKRKIPLIAIASIILVILITSLRTSRKILESIYVYFTIPLGLLNHYTNLLDQTNFYSYGGAFFYPITYIINSFNTTFGIDNNAINEIVQYVNMPQDKWVSTIYSSGSYNAFSTLYYYFYMDFRYIGVLLFSFLFGMICEFIYFKAWVQRNTNFTPPHLLFLQAVFGSFIIWQLGNTKLVLSLVILYLLQKKKHNKARQMRN